MECQEIKMGGSFKAREIEALKTLVSDCVNYGLTERQALAYIKARLGKDISKKTYYQRKKEVDTGKSANEWLNFFTKVGFVIKHKQIIEVIETIQKDTLQDYLIEQNRNHNDKDKHEIRQLRYEIRENAKLLQELSLGTPIIAQIKAKLENVEMLQSSK